MQIENGDSYIKTINARGGEQVQIPVTRKFPITYTLIPYNHGQTKEFSWSPDSKKIAYRSDKGGQDNIWTVNADGSNDAQFTQNSDAKSSVFCPLWSNDGKRIAYGSRKWTREADNKFLFAFFVEDPDTENSRAVFQISGYTKLIGWSPDEKELDPGFGTGR